MTRPGRRTAVLLFAIAATAGCDQAAKQIAARRLSEGGAVEVLFGAARFELAENRGGFLGLGGRLPEDARRGLFVGLTGAGLLGGAALLVRRRRIALAPALGLALVLGGGFGNLVDRALRGTVTDFLVLRLGPLHTGVFNVADAAILAGTALAFLAWPRAGVH